MRIVIRVLHRHPIVVSDPITGWRGRPNLEQVDVFAAGGHFLVSTDAEGHRRLVGNAAVAATSESPAVVIVGDSFAYGLSVSDSETFAQQLSAELKGRELINLGVPGYGSDQELLGLEQFFRDHPTQKVGDIVVLIYENDFRDVQRFIDPRLGYTKPLFHATATGLARGEFHRSFIERAMDDSRLVWIIDTETASLRSPALPVNATDAGAPVVMSCLQALRKTGEAHGARVHLFAHRLLKRPSTVSAMVWSDFLARTGATDITDSLLVGTGPDPLSFDHAHWSREGNRRAAALIARTL